jgi:hypothetical protein
VQQAVRGQRRPRLLLPDRPLVLPPRPVQAARLLLHLAQERVPLQLQVRRLVQLRESRPLRDLHLVLLLPDPEQRG